MERLHELFVWGFDGTRVTPSLRKTLKKLNPAGVILFKRNIQSEKQLKELTRDLRKVMGPKFLIGIDEEGGRVSRLPETALKYPPASLWGKVYQREGNASTIEKLGKMLGVELKSLGINLDFAPVLDVNSNPKNPIIGNRAFSDNPILVAKVACAFEKGLRSGGIITCGKHFPGHGDTYEDSHLTLPRVKRSEAVLEKTEIIPFRRAILQKIPMLMTAHVVYDAWDQKTPATFSRKILYDLLREKLGFQGVVISDDLQMKAVAKDHSLDEACLLSLEAGVNLLLICEKMEELGEDLLEKINRKVAKSSALQSKISESFKHLEVLRRRYLS